MEKKITKRDVLTAIKTYAETGEIVGVSIADIVNYVDVTIAQLDAKAAKAKEKAAEKKTEGDALRTAVEAALTDEYQTINEILAAVDVEDVTAAKVSARLTALVNAGLAHKDKVKTVDGRTLNGYAAGPAVTVED